MSFVHKCAEDGSSDLSLHDVPEDRACYLTSYTQEWFACEEHVEEEAEGGGAAHQTAKTTTTTTTAAACVVPRCPHCVASASASLPNRPQRDGQSSRTGYVCKICRAGRYCSEACFQQAWADHKWPSKTKPLDCNRSPYRKVNRLLMSHGM